MSHFYVSLHASCPTHPSITFSLTLEGLSGLRVISVDIKNYRTSLIPNKQIKTFQKCNDCYSDANLGVIVFFVWKEI